MSIPFTVYMTNIVYLHNGEPPDSLNVFAVFTLSHGWTGTDGAWAVTVLLAISSRSDRHLNRHLSVLHRSTQPLACFFPPILMPSAGPSLLSSWVPI